MCNGFDKMTSVWDANIKTKVSNKPTVVASSNLCTKVFDQPLSDGNGTLGDYIPDRSKPMEKVIADRMLLEQLFARLRELDPDADTIIQCWLDDYKISDRAIAEKLGRKQRTFADQMKKIRTELRKIRGY